jgi:hypothetical protein
VGPAEQSDLSDRRLPAERNRNDVVELEEPGRRATMAVLADKRTPRRPTFSHGTADVRRNRPGSRRLARPARLVRGSELPFLELDDQRVQGAVDHRRDVALSPSRSWRERSLSWVAPRSSLAG